MISTSTTPPPRAAGSSGDKHHLPGPMSNLPRDMGPVPAAVVIGGAAGKELHPMIAKLADMIWLELN